MITEKDFDDKDIRKSLAEKSIFMFALIYFPQLFKSLVPKFHKKWYKLLKFKHLETKRSFIYLILLAFRESAKTTLCKIKITRDICYKRKKLISYVCYEKEKSGEALFDIATWLQTNKLLINDFGNLFQTAEYDDKKPEKKTINNFVTSNGVRVAAFSIRQSVRGRLFDFDRPDCYVIDDFENNITKKSAAITRKVIEFLKELMTGIGPGAEVVFSCNRISDTGSVQWLIDTADKNPEFCVDEVAVIENGKSVWPSKFVVTDEEAEAINSQRPDPSTHVVSLESKKRTMNADGTKTFEQEMMNEALTQGDRFFDVDKIDMRIKVLKDIEWQDQDPNKPNYRKKEGDWWRWGEANKDHNNVVSADVSEGYGIDSSVIDVFDMNDGKQIAEYESNRCSPELLGQMMVEEGKKAGYCILLPERNNVGVGTIQAIKVTGYVNMHREKTVDGITNKPIYKYGWHTNGKTKPIMLFEFKRDFEAGLIQINSISLLREMRAFGNNDVAYSNFDPEASNHFDRVMAACIAWQGRNYKQIKGYIM
jgi:hypothetical protein